MSRDDTEFIKILEAHKGIVYKITNAYAQDSEDRKDLEQEIVIQIWKSLAQFKGQSKISTWIYRVALNVSISHNRKEKNRDKLNNSISDVIIETTKSPKLALQSDKSRLLNQFINQLDRFNKAIILLYLDDYSYEEIADIIGITKSNVGVKINRIKAQLRTKFDSQKITS